VAVIRTNGWLQWRRGILEHLFTGKISKAEYILYTVILAFADPTSGIWEGSAELLARCLEISDRSCRFQLANLEQKGYIKRFQTPGKNGSYPIFVHNYECTFGAVTGHRLNAAKSTSSRMPVYDDCRDIAAAVAGTLPPSLLDKERTKKLSRARAGPTPTPSQGNGYTRKPSRPSDGSRSMGAGTPEEQDRIMAVALKRIEEGKPVDPVVVLNVRAWQEAKKKGPVAIRPAELANAR
jgi:hypothetical protein